MNNFNRIVAVAVALAFLMTSFVPQNAFSSQEINKETKILNSIKNALPKSAGYITEHNIIPGNSVLVYIQDLHCNPGVQKNISDIISSIDKNIGVDKVILEGVPEGKVENNVLTSLPESVKYSVVEKLLQKGLLTGVELYSVDTDKNNIYGVENWDKYIENLQRAADLLYVRDSALKSVSPFENEVHKKTKKTLDILGDLSSFKRDDKWYKKLSEAEINYAKPIYEYENLSNYVNLREISGKIDFKKVKKELDIYTQNLKNILSYKDYNNIVSKVNDHFEYYEAIYNTAEKGDIITFMEEFPNLYLFLTYSIKSSKVNPILVFYDEETYVNKILSSESNEPAKFESLLLFRMTSLLSSYLSLSMTDNEFEYFSGNIELYKTFISRQYPHYYGLISSYLDNPEYDKYYNLNRERNNVFYDNLIKNISGTNEINVFVSGGFHTSLVENFKNNGISYVLITPVVLDDFNSAEVYNKLIEINSSVPNVLRNALNPIPFMLAALPDIPKQSREAYLSELVNSIAESSQNYRSPQVLQSIIEEWIRNIKGIDDSSVSVSYGEGIFKIKILEQVLEFKIKNGLIDINNSELFVPKTVKYNPVISALKAAGERFSIFAPGINDYTEHFAVRTVNKAAYMGMKISGEFFSSVSKRKEDKWSFRLMMLMHKLGLNKMGRQLVASVAWAHIKASSNVSVPVKQTVLEIDGRKINIIIEGIIEFTDNDLLEIINNARNLPRGRAEITELPDTIYVGMLEKSSHLFENFTGLGFIGVNKAIYEIGLPKQDMQTHEIDASLKHAKRLQKIIFKLGLTHEIAHEFMGKAGGKEIEKFENIRLMQDIAYIINEVKKIYPLDMTLFDADYGQQQYNEKIKNDYILPYLTNILEGSVFLKKLSGYKLTLNELIELIKEKGLSDADIMHLEETYFTTKNDKKSDAKKENEDRFFSSILLEKMKDSRLFHDSDFLKNPENKDNLKIIIAVSVELKTKFEEILYSSNQFDNDEIARMTSAFQTSFFEGLEILYRTLPDHLFERYFHDNTMVKEHGLSHSIDILKYMMDILAQDKESLRILSDKNIKYMVYGALFHDISTVISRGNHEHNSAIMAMTMLEFYQDKGLTEEDIIEIAHICEGHRKIEDDSKLRPEHSNYFACLLHDADAFSAVLELDRIFGVWAEMPNSTFFNSGLSTEERVNLIKANNFLDGDAVNDLIRQGYYRRKPHLYITEGAKTIIISNQSRHNLLNYFKTKEALVAKIHGGKYKNPEKFKEMLETIDRVIDALESSPLQQNIDLQSQPSAFTFKSRMFLLWQMIKDRLGSQKVNYPKNIFMSDVHGGYDRLLDLLLNAFDAEETFIAHKEDMTEAEIKAHNENVQAMKTKKLVSALNTSDINAIYVGGDSVDRGDGQLKTLDLLADIAKSGKLRYVMGNHDLWAFMNIMGIHLPYYRNYQGIDEDYEDMYGNVKEFLVSMIDIDQKATGLGSARAKENGATNKSLWEERHAAYMQYAKSNQKTIWDAKYKEVCGLFEKAYGFKLSDKGKDVLNRPEGIFKNHEELRKFWGLLLGRNVGVMVSTGLRAADQMSINWWKDKAKELLLLKENFVETQEQSMLFDVTAEIINEIIMSQSAKMKEEVGRGNWMWRALDALMYRNYESVEWWSQDWRFHSSWGGGNDGLIAQINQETDSKFRSENQIETSAALTEKQAESLKDIQKKELDKRLEYIGKFFQNNFFLYKIDEYGTYMMHSMLPVDDDGDIAIGKVVKGKIEKLDENGKRIKGFYYKGKRYYRHSLFKGLERISKDIREFDFEKGDPSAIIEGLILINSWYADLTTEIKPNDIKNKHQRIGIGKILANMGKGVMRLTVGHNPVSKSNEIGVNTVKFSGEKKIVLKKGEQVMKESSIKRIVLSIDDEFSKRYAPPMGKGTINIHKGDIGIISSSFESGKENAVIVSSILVSKKEFLRSVLYDINFFFAALQNFIDVFNESYIYYFSDYLRSRLYKSRDIWDRGNTLVVNIIKDLKEEKNLQHYNTSALNNKKVNIVGIELKERDTYREIGGYSEISELPESQNRLFKINDLKVTTPSGDFIEIPVSFMHEKIRKSEKYTNYISVYVGLEAKKIIDERCKKEIENLKKIQTQDNAENIIEADAEKFRQDLKNSILYAATATFIEKSKKRGNVFQKKIIPVNSKRKILLKTSSIQDFDNALSDEQRRSMYGVLTVHDNVPGVSSLPEEKIDDKFLKTLTSVFGNLVFSDFYTINPAVSSLLIEKTIDESVQETKTTAEILAAA